MFGRSEVSKSQQQDKSKYTVYIPYLCGNDKFYKDINLALSYWLTKTENYIQVVSIDPAIQNFGFRIERRYMTGKIVPIVYCRLNFASVRGRKAKPKKEEYSDSSSSEDDEEGESKKKTTSGEKPKKNSRNK